MSSSRVFCWPIPTLTLIVFLTLGAALSQVMPKAQVANLISKVENGVDEFRDYLKRRGENAQANVSAAAANQQNRGRRANRGTATESRTGNAQARKDELDDALGDLNQSTNRLRRKFDATDKWMETRVQVERVLDDARKVNQAVVRGNYGSQSARLWATLRTGINDLARAYGLQPLAI